MMVASNVYIGGSGIHSLDTQNPLVVFQQYPDLELKKKKQFLQAEVMKITIKNFILKVERSWRSSSPYVRTLLEVGLYLRDVESV